MILIFATQYIPYVAGSDGISGFKLRVECFCLGFSTPPPPSWMHTRQATAAQVWHDDVPSHGQSACAISARKVSGCRRLLCVFDFDHVCWASAN